MFLSHIMGKVLIYGAGRIILNNYIRVFQKNAINTFRSFFFFWNENESLEMTVPIHKDSQQKKKKKVKIQLRDAILSKWSETGQRSGYLQCEFFSMTTPIDVQFCHITKREQRTRHMSLMKIRKKSPNKHPAPLQAQLMPGSLCTGLTHPTTLSFGALARDPPTCSCKSAGCSFLPLDLHLWFIFSFQIQGLQMKSLQIASVNPNSPGYQTSPISSGFPFFSELLSSVNYKYSTDQVPKFPENGLSVCLSLQIFYPTKTLAWGFNLCSDLTPPPERSGSHGLRWNL